MRTEDASLETTTLLTDRPWSEGYSPPLTITHKPRSVVGRLTALEPEIREEVGWDMEIVRKTLNTVRSKRFYEKCFHQIGRSTGNLHTCVQVATIGK